MPGKVNPVIPEVVNQVAYLVIGHDLTVTMCAEGGQLQLNAFEPTIGYSILTSLRMLTAAIETLNHRCVAGIEADRERCSNSSRTASASSPRWRRCSATRPAPTSPAGRSKKAARSPTSCWKRA